MLLKLTTIKRKRDRLWRRLSLLGSLGDEREHLTCRQGARQGFHLNTGPVTRWMSGGTSNKRATGRRAAICPPVYLQMKTTEAAERELPVLQRLLSCTAELPAAPAHADHSPGRCAHTRVCVQATPDARSKQDLISR